MSSLKDKTIKGVWWSFADNISGQGVTFLTGLILARLLSPSEYGLIGIITIFINIFNAIVDSGFSSSLIRKKEADSDDYNTMFIVNIVISTLLFILLFFLAPVISNFFYSPELKSLCRVMGVIVIINATAIVQNTYLTRKLDFKTKTKASFVSSITSGIIGIFLAYIGFGVWALVFQQIIRHLINSVILWICSKYFVHLTFSVCKFKEMWSFGWKILLSSIVHTVWCELTQVVIGRCYNPSSLGYYTRANQFSCIFSSNLTSIVQRVSLPALSKLQNDEVKLKNTYKKIIRTTMYVTFVLMIGMAACSKSIVLTLLGAKWLNTVMFLRLLCFSMLLYPLNALNLTMLVVKNRSDLYLRTELIKKVILLIPIIVGIFINIYWMLISNIISSILCYFVNAHYSGTLIQYSIKEQIKDLMPSLILAISMGSILLGIDYCFNLFPIVLLIVELAIGVSFVLIISHINKLKEYEEIKQIVYNYIFKNKKSI